MQELYQNSQNDLQNIRSVDQWRIFSHECIQKFEHFYTKITNIKDSLVNKPLKTLMQLIKNEKEKEKILQIYRSFGQTFFEIGQQARVVYDNLLQQLPNDDQQQGLSPRSIRTFHLFTADETLVGQQCAICLEDITVGRRLRRLTCDGQHSFCPGCCETWFANKNTCPLCRHVFV